MGYDGDFYEAYERYLLEPRVRTKHDQIFALWGSVAKWGNVIDLGCGRSTEYRRFGPTASNYQGFDVNEGEWAIAANYREPGLVETVRALGWPPTVLVSLFSSECTATALENAELYGRLFREVPAIKHALVAGFYYAGRRDVNPIEETGGIVSWQSVSSIEDDVSDVYEEIRVTTRVPSTMFGEDVVEVWRMFTRR